MDKKKIQEGVKLILEGIGENPDREGLLDTPDRIARMLYADGNIMEGYPEITKDNWNGNKKLHAAD